MIVHWSWDVFVWEIIVVGCAGVLVALSVLVLFILGAANFRPDSR
jgi:hypothetical protein